LFIYPFIYPCLYSTLSPPHRRKSNVEISQSFTIFSPHFWLLKPSKITSFLKFWIFLFTFQQNFSGKNNGIKGLSDRICHRGPNPLALKVRSQAPWEICRPATEDPFLDIKSRDVVAEWQNQQQVQLGLN
jgi:hypothetical protein